MKMETKPSDFSNGCCLWLCRMVSYLKRPLWVVAGFTMQLVWMKTHLSFTFLFKKNSIISHFICHCCLLPSMILFISKVCLDLKVGYYVTNQISLLVFCSERSNSFINEAFCLSSPTYETVAYALAMMSMACAFGACI